MEKINRKKFFGILAASSVLGFVVASLPHKILKNVSNVSKKKVIVKIHPDAIKRNKV